MPQNKSMTHSNSIRLNKYISESGICSRRDADRFIEQGKVFINGRRAQLGDPFFSGSTVTVNGIIIEPQRAEDAVFIALNKPIGIVSTTEKVKDNIVTFVNHSKRIFPIGRLDRNTTGVLLFTNDGEVATRLMHPKYEVEKVYKATLNKTLKGEDFWQISNGVDLEDGFIKPDEIAYPDQKNKTVVGIQIHSGRNRIIHRIFEHMDYVVEKLDRVSYGGFVKTGLKRGESRMMDDKEIKMLKRLVKLA